MDPHSYDVSFEVEDDHWWFSGRRAILLDQINRCAAARGRLLDLGCGTGSFLGAVGRTRPAFGLDVSLDALCFCRKRGLTRLAQAPIGRAPFAHGTFDVVTANDVLEHLDDDLEGARAILRLLKPGGLAIVLVPAFDFLWSLQDDVGHHRRRYTAPRLSALLSRAGFAVKRITYFNALLFPPIWVGRQLLKVARRFRSFETENDLHPRWSNAVLRRIFGLETSLLRRFDLPFGVSLLAVCERP